MTRMGATKKSVGHRLSRRVWIRVRRDVRSSFFSATVCRDDDGGLASVSRVSSAVGSLRAVYLRNGSEIVFHCNGGLLSRIYHFRLIWMIHGTVRFEDVVSPGDQYNFGTVRNVFFIHMSNHTARQYVTKVRAHANRNRT